MLLGELVAEYFALEGESWKTPQEGLDLRVHWGPAGLAPKQFHLGSHCWIPMIGRPVWSLQLCDVLPTHQRESRADKMLSAEGYGPEWEVELLIVFFLEVTADEMVTET